MTLKEADGDDLATALKDRETPGVEKLTEAQIELLRDMRVSLRQLKRGEGLPAREALREIRVELESEDNAGNSDA